MRKAIASVLSVTCFLAALPALAQQEPPPPAPPEPPAEAQQVPPEAQQPYPPPAPYPYAQPQPYPYGYPMQLESPELMYRKGRRLRTVGMVLTFVGIGLGALGLALLYDRYTARNDVDEFIEALFGVMLTASGIGCFIPGVILWPIGSSKMDDAMRMGASGLSQNPWPAYGANLVWRF